MFHAFASKVHELRFLALSTVNDLLCYSFLQFTSSSRFLNGAVLYVDYTNRRLRIYAMNTFSKMILIRLFAAAENNKAPGIH